MNLIQSYCEIYTESSFDLGMVMDTDMDTDTEATEVMEAMADTEGSAVKTKCVQCANECPNESKNKVKLVIRFHS